MDMVLGALRCTTLRQGIKFAHSSIATEKIPGPCCSALPSADWKETETRSRTHAWLHRGMFAIPSSTGLCKQCHVLRCPNGSDNDVGKSRGRGHSEQTWVGKI